MTDKDFALYLINQLGETDEVTKLSLLIMVKELGQTDCQTILEQAKENQGELINDGSRERTLGGLFFKNAGKQTSHNARKKASKLLKELRETP